MKHFLYESLKVKSATWLTARVFSKRRKDSRLERVLMDLLKPIGRGLSKSDRSSIRSFLTTLKVINSKNGSSFTVKWLKVQYVNFQQAVGGNPSRDLTPLGCRIRRSGDGLPVIIPKSDRFLIRSGDVATIRKWITLFGLYRELIVPGKLKLESITSPCTGDPELKMLNIKTFRLYMGIRKPPSLEAKPFPISSKGASASRYTAGSLGGFLAALQAWDNLPYKSNLYNWLRITGSQRLIAMIDEFRMAEYAFYPLRNAYVGRLGFKDEPAGKVRVFAMVDPITQWALRPLHDWIASILRKIPMDGTYNQLGPLQNIPWDRAHYCFDLSSATDRLPVQLTQRLLSGLIGEDQAKCWVALLVDREYWSARTKEAIRYNCGQPMGALTSWSLGLALLHHWIVQTAAQRAGCDDRFDDYALLGDDIVIWNGEVAHQYQLILKELGVEISLPKSLISTSAVEFAKRFLVKGEDCSPVSFGEWWTATHNLGAANEFRKHYPVLQNEYLWKRSMGLTRIGALKFGRISTTYSILSRLSASESLYDFFSRDPKGYLTVLSEDIWTYISERYMNRTLTSVKDQTFKMIQNIWVLQGFSPISRKNYEIVGYKRPPAYCVMEELIPATLLASVEWLEILLNRIYCTYQDWEVLIDKGLHLEEDLIGLPLDPGNLDFWVTVLKQSKEFALFFDEQRHSDKVRLWTVDLYRQVHRL